MSPKIEQDGLKALVFAKLKAFQALFAGVEQGLRRVPRGLKLFTLSFVLDILCSYCEDSTTKTGSSSALARRRYDCQKTAEISTMPSAASCIHPALR